MKKKNKKSNNIDIEAMHTTEENTPVGRSILYVHRTQEKKIEKKAKCPPTLNQRAFAMPLSPPGEQEGTLL